MNAQDFLALSVVAAAAVGLAWRMRRRWNDAMSSHGSCATCRRGQKTTRRLIEISTPRRKRES